MSRAGWRRAAHPFAIAAAIACIGASSLLVPRRGPDATWLGARLPGGQKIQAVRARGEVMALREATGEIRWVDPEAESWDEIARGLREGSVARVWGVNDRRRIGVWSHVAERATRGVVVEGLAGEWSEADEEVVRGEFAVRYPLRMAAAGVESPEFVARSRVLWGGVLLDALTLALVGAFVWLAWRTPAWWRSVLTAGQGGRRCSGCGYDLSDSGAEGRCPECGRAFPPR